MIHQTYTVYKVTSTSQPSHVYIGTTTRGTATEDVLKEHRITRPDAEVEFMESIAGDEKVATIGVCWHLLLLQKENFLCDNTWHVLNDDLDHCDASLRQYTQLAMLEFYEKLSDDAVEWVLKKHRNSNSKRAIGKSNLPVTCQHCGFECIYKNLKRHQAGSRCKTRRVQSELTPQTMSEARATKKQKLLEKQNTKHPCPICGCMTAKRHLRRHQEGGKCKKQDVCV